MTDTVRTWAANLANLADAQLPGAISAQDVRDFMVSVPSLVGMANVMEPRFGAKGDGVTNDTQAFVSANSALPTSGGKLYAPTGTYLIDPGVLTIAKTGVHLIGDGWQNTTLKRSSDTGGDLINVTGSQFNASNILLQDVLGGTNTGRLLHLNFLNDVELHRVWFQFAYELCFTDTSTNVGFNQCIFESGKRFGLRGYQSSDVRATGSAFYTNGSLSYADGLSAQLKIEKDPGYAFDPFSWKVTGNTFLYSNIGHHIYADQTAGLTVTGNSFDFAGLFDAGNYDDIKLTNCRYTSIGANTASAEINTYSAGARASRYNVNLDANCRNTVIGANAFKTGASGSVNDLAPDTVILPSLNAEGPRRFLTASTTWDPPSVNASAQTTTTLSVSNSIVGDPVAVGFSNDLQGMQLTGYVSANGTVTVVLRNGTVGAIDLASGTLRADVLRH